MVFRDTEEKKSRFKKDWQKTPRGAEGGRRPIGVSPGREGPKSGEPRVFKYFLCYYILFEIVAFEKRLVLKFDTRSCHLGMKAAIPWFPYHINY